MSFTEYSGTPYSRWLMPIIPAGATLSPGSKLTPQSLGKIPGLRNSSGSWYGYDWANFTARDGVFPVWDRWYAEEKPPATPTIGLNARLFPAIDIDVGGRAAGEIAMYAQLMLGPALIRTRPNSSRRLLMYRLEQGADGLFVTKLRRSFIDRDGGEQAIEILGKGQQYLIEGRHPSGVDYVWEDGKTPLNTAPQPVTALQLQEWFWQIGEFLQKPDYGWVPNRKTGKFTMSTGTAPTFKIALDSPLCAPSIAALTSLLRDYLTVTSEELAAYDDWERCCRAIKAACGGDETFYDEVYLPWSLANPNNSEELIRQKWDSHTDSSVGWPTLCDAARPHGYMDDVIDGFKPADHGEEDSVNAIEGEAVNGRQAGMGAGPPQAVDAEIEIARAFAERHGKTDWIYVPTSRTGGLWKRHTENGWVDDQTILHEVLLECDKISAAIRGRANLTQQEKTHARNLVSTHTGEAIVRQLKAHPQMIVQRDELDAQPWVLGVPGGYVDEQGRLCEPDPSRLITKCAGVAPAFGKPCPKWEALLMNITNGEREVYETLRLAIGCTFSGTGREQRFFFLYGADGGEGKTTMLTTLHNVLGDYGAVLQEGAFTRHANRFAFGCLEGARFVYSGELSEGEEWSEAVLKDKTGSGKTTIERKGVDSIDISIRYALWFQGNHIPRFRKPDPALRRRLAIFECRTPLKERKVGFDEALFKAEGPAILAWCITAMLDYRVLGLTIPDEMEADQEEHLNSQDPYRQFIEEMLEFNPDARTSVTDLYQAWIWWREEEGLPRNGAGSRETFSKQLHNHELCRKARVIRGRHRGEKQFAEHTMDGLRVRKDG